MSAEEQRDAGTVGTGHPEDCLRAAMHASTPMARDAAARAGLEAAAAEDANPDTVALLWRQRYRARLDTGDLEGAVRSARHAAKVSQAHRGVGIRDVAEHDLARVLWALGRHAEAIGAARIAARVAPANRRGFQLCYLATLLQHHGQQDAALATLRRARRATPAGRARLWVLAQEAVVRLEAGRAAPGLPAIVRALSVAENHQGYGQYLAGMLAFRMGDQRTAQLHLTSFLRRHSRLEQTDPAKALTLREELSRARDALATFVTH